MSLAVTPETVVVPSRRQRYNVWRLDGTHERTLRLPSAGGRLGHPNEFHSLADGAFVGFKAIWAGLLAAVVTPLIAWWALSSASMKPEPAEVETGTEAVG